MSDKQTSRRRKVLKVLQSYWSHSSEPEWIHEPSKKGLETERFQGFFWQKEKPSPPKKPVLCEFLSLNLNGISLWANEDAQNINFLSCFHILLCFNCSLFLLSARYAVFIPLRPFCFGWKRRDSLEQLFYWFTGVYKDDNILLSTTSRTWVGIQFSYLTLQLVGLVW